MLSLEMAFFLFYRQKPSLDLLALCAQLTEVCRSKKVDKITQVVTLKGVKPHQVFLKNCSPLAQRCLKPFQALSN